MALDKTNLVTFKRGLEASLASASIVKDAFYLTTDTHRLYVGVEETDGSTHPALLNSAVKVYATLADLTNDKQYKPAIGDIAFVEKDDEKKWLNALIMYNSNGWTQINYSDVEVRELIKANADAIALKADKTYVDGEVDTLEAAIALKADKTYVDGLVDDLNIENYATINYVDGEVDTLEAAIALKADQTYVEGQVSTLDGKITTAQNKANSAYDLAAQADGKADVNAATIGTLDKDNMGATVVEYIGKVKATADAAATKTDVATTVEGLEATIGAVDEKADGIAEDLEALAGEVVYATNGVFTNTPKVGDVAVATVTDVANAKTEIIGGATTLTTLKAVEDKRTEDLNAIDAKFAKIQGSVEDLANVMAFAGVADQELADNSTATITISGKEYTPDKGDVVIDKNGEEFVWDGEAWKQFGSASATTAMLTALEEAIEANTEAIEANDADILALQKADTAIGERIDDVEAVANAAATKEEFDDYVESNDAALKVVADKVNHETTGLAATYTLAANAATKSELSAEVTARETAVAEIVEQLTWGSF